MTLAIAISPFINNCEYKRIAFIFLIFLFLQFHSKYGKCMFINIERFFLKEKFKEGFVFNLIKPIICYKRNIFYKEYYFLMIFYAGLLFYQIQNTECRFF